MDVNITKEFLLTSSATRESSATLWDYETLNALKFFKNGNSIPPKSLQIIAQDYIVGAEPGTPILQVWMLNGQNCSKTTRLVIPGPATCLATCPKGLYLAVGMNCKVYVWQLASGKLLSIHQKNYQPITVIKFSSDGDYLLIAGQDGILVVYNFAELINLSNSFLTQADVGEVEPLYIKHDHSMAIQDLHVGSFGRKSRFATVSSDLTCKMYNLADGEALFTLVFTQMLSSVYFDASCWQLFVGTFNGIIHNFNLKNPPVSPYHHVDANNSVEFKGHSKKIVCLAINISNTVLASGSEDNVVNLWDIKTRQILKMISLKEPVTNVMFVLAYNNFFSEKMKPGITLKSLERNTASQSTKLTICQMQKEDISWIDKQLLESEHSLKSLMKENLKLRSINAELYYTALEINKKYN